MSDMSIEPALIADLHFKHLEMLQTAISRVSNYNATIKNYCITLVTAIAGFVVTLHRPLVILLTLLPIFVFAVLDTQYLRTERRFRLLYEQARQENWQRIPSFEMNPSVVPRPSFWKCFLSWSIASFYIPMIIGVISIYCIASYG